MRFQACSLYSEYFIYIFVIPLTQQMFPMVTNTGIEIGAILGELLARASTFIGIILIYEKKL